MTLCLFSMTLLFSMTFQAWKMVFLNSTTFQDQWSPWTDIARSNQQILNCYTCWNLCSSEVYQLVKTVRTNYFNAEIPYSYR